MNLSLKNKVKSARTLKQYTTFTDIKRSDTGQIKEIYSVSRLVPNKISLDKEQLHDEHIMLKLMASNAFSENLSLKKTLKNLEIRQDSKRDASPDFILTASLREEIIELKQILEEKKNDLSTLRKNMRVFNIVECEKDLKSIQEECRKVLGFLNKYSQLGDPTYIMHELENAAYYNTQEISKLRKDNQEAFNQLTSCNDEIKINRDKLAYFEKKKRKSLVNPFELDTLTEEYEYLKSLRVSALADYNAREAVLQKELQDAKKHKEELKLRYIELENQIEANTKAIENLRRKLSLAKTDTKFEEAPLENTSSKIKEKCPPRILVKINEIIKAKNLLIAVFLSLLDKNNNGLLETGELQKGINVRGKPTKAKHVEELLKILMLDSKRIPLYMIEEYYEKYEYPDDYCSSSDEEVKEIPKKKNIEKLFSKEVKPSTNLSEVIIPQAGSVATQNIVREKEKIIQFVSPSELADVLERIRIHMQNNYVPKTRFSTTLFGNNFHPDIPVTVSEIQEVLQKSNVYFGETEEIEIFARFLVEPEGSGSLPESKYKQLQAGVLDFSRKLQKAIQNWYLIDKYKAHLEIYTEFCMKKSEIFKKVKDLDLNEDTIVNLQDFNKIIYDITKCSVDALQYLYLISYSASKKLNRILYNDVYIGLEVNHQKIIDLKQKYSEGLGSIEKKLKEKDMTFNEVFGYSNEFLVSMDQVSDAIRKLGIDPDNDLLNELNIGRYTCNLGLLNAMIKAQTFNSDY